MVQFFRTFFTKSEVRLSSMVCAIIVLATLAIPIVSHACAFNCSKTPELRASGFAIKSEGTAPFANSYRGDTPKPSINDAGSSRLIIWLHGQHNPRIKETCSKQWNLPPKSILTLAEMKNTHVYYHCTKVIDPKEEGQNVPDDGIHYKGGRKNGSYTLSRVGELGELLDAFIALGVQPENITLSGHSAGGWTSLLAAATYPEKFSNLIAFAPAFAGPRNEESLYPWWRKIILPEQVEMIKTPNEIKKLVFAYEDDAYNRPQELTFLTDAFPDTAQLVAQKCGGGHVSHKKDCDFDKSLQLMKELIGN